MRHEVVRLYRTLRYPDIELSAVSVSPVTTDAVPVARYVPFWFGSVHEMVCELVAPAASVTLFAAPAVPPLTARETVKVSV